MIYNINSTEITLDNYKTTAVFLFKLAGLLKTVKFRQWMNSNESIYPHLGKPTHDHMRGLLSWQLAYPEGLSRRCKIEHKIKHISHLSYCLASFISDQHGFKILKKHRKFEFDENLSDNSLILEFLDKDNLKDIVVVNNISQSYVFDFWNGFHELLRFAEAKKTLTIPIQNEMFQQHILSIPEDSIVGNSFAGDLLIHDAAVVRKNPHKKIVIYFDKDKYSSFIDHKYEKCPPRRFSHRVYI